MLSNSNHQPPGSRPLSRASTTSAMSPPQDDVGGRFRPAETKQEEQHQKQQQQQQQQQHHHHHILDAETMLRQLQTHQSAISQQQTHYEQQQQQQQQQQPQQHHSQPAYQMHDMSQGFAPESHPQQYMPPQQQQLTFGARMGSADVVVGGPDDRRRKGSALTASNDRELREMLVKNEGRPLREVAQEVIQKERTPMAEKTKQLFAMLWLRTVCKPAKTSVPRNRVYSQYASRCGTERVVPLNPASFGKLVRVIFPGIQTRRLGVRGESKYHYVDLALEDESFSHPSFGGATTTKSASNTTYDPRARRSDSLSTQAPAPLDFNQPQRSLPPDTAAFPSTTGPYDSAPAPNLPSRARAFAYPDSRGMSPHTPESLTYPHTLRFPSAPIPEFSENEPVHLPSLQPYLPPRTDPDTAAALFALYRTHCTSLIDSIRFCKEKQFFRLYTSFHGTLTVPVQKLFAHPSLAPWIESCDLITYRTMIRFVSRLTLQAAPVVVINILSNISATLHAHLTKTFAAHPPHVVQAKLRPATIFARLLHRLIRVNQAAHAAANLLTIEQNRVQMWREWVGMVNPKRVVEAEVPPVDGAQEEVYAILTLEMRRLLEPLPAAGAWGEEDVYGFTAYEPPPTGDGVGEGGFAEFLQAQTHTTPPNSGCGGSGGGSSTTENVLDRWANFLYTLPSRFPRATARQLLQGLSGVGTAALRDVTILNGLSYGHWWVLKIFVDEMGLWLGEMGGFLEPEGWGGDLGEGMMFGGPPQQQMYGGGSTTTRPPGQPPMMMTFHQPVPPVQPQQQQGKYHHAAAAPHNQHPPETDLDDSGIGLELMDAHSPDHASGGGGVKLGVEGMIMTTGTRDLL